jgi:hypothetical protein
LIGIAMLPKSRPAVRFVLIFGRHFGSGKAFFPMATDETPHSYTDPGFNPWRQVDWQYALGMFATALLLLGTVALFQWCLPNHTDGAAAAAIGVVFVSRMAAYKLGVLPWRSQKRVWHSIFSLPQALMEGLAFFVFMVAVLTFPRWTLSSFDLSLAAIGGLAIGMFSGWYYPAKTIS